MNTTNDTETMVLSERDAIELLGFLVASARGLLTEPQDYGHKRLLEAAKRLSAATLLHSGRETAVLFAKLAEEIPDWTSEHRRDPDGYVDFIDDCCRDIARELMRRDAQEGGAK